jgi:hypothetical protein
MSCACHPLTWGTEGGDFNSLILMEHTWYNTELKKNGESKPNELCNAGLPSEG